ncbi:MAG: oligosaccharide flippase family protein [Clostridia bacterium]|nr:oligosaccharide flippase family protein [Clostridia bacterium]
MKGKSQIKAGAILSYVAIALNLIAGLLYTPWMKAQIGDGAFGLYTIANSLITLFLVDFGLSTAVSRYVSKYKAEGNQEKINSFLGAIYKLYLIIDAVILIALVVVYFFIDTIHSNFSATELEQFKVIYIISALFAVINFPCVTFNGILNAYEKYIPLKLADIIYRVLLVGVTIITLLLGGGLYGLVTVHAVVGLVIIVYKLIVIGKTTPVKVNFKSHEKGLYKEIFSFSMWTTITVLAQRLILNITPSIITMVTPYEEILVGTEIVTAGAIAAGVFGIVTTLEQYVYSITNAINGMFMPRIATMYEKQGEDADLTPLLMKVGKFQFGLNSLIVVGFFTVGESFIRRWTGPQDIDAYWGLLLICIPSVFYYALQIANTAAIVKKKVYIQAIVTAVVGVINVGLSFVLTHYYGVIGACLSIFIAYTVRVILYLIIYSRVLNINMGKFMLDCYLRMSIPALLSAGAGYLMNYFIASDSWLNIILRGAIIVVVFAGLTYAIGISRQERSAINSYIARIFNKIFKKKTSK